MIFDSTKSTTMMIVNPDAFGSLSEVLNTTIFEAVQAEVIGNLSSVFEAVIGPIALQSALGSIKEISNGILAYNGIQEDKLSFYKFRINPVRAQTGFRKILDVKFTGGGFDSDTRGEELITKRFQCTTGSLIPTEVNAVPNIVRDLAGQFPTGVEDLNDLISRNPKLSGAYIKFVTFRHFWQLHHDDLLFLFEDDAYLGKLSSLDIDEDAMKPYEITFSFDLQIYPGKFFNLYTGYINEDLFQSFKSTRTLEETESNLLNDLTGKKIIGEILDSEQRLLNDYNSSSLSGLRPKDNLGKAKKDIKASILTNPLQLSRYLRDINKTDIDIFEDVATFNVFTGTTPEIGITSDQVPEEQTTNEQKTEQEILNTLPTN